MDDIEECTLLGFSLLEAQKLEFALYGLVSYLSHTKEAKKEKRFRELTPEKFLRGPVEELKITLGQLETAFGKKLLLSNGELKEFIKNRNLIAHNYWRLTKANIKDGERLDNPKDFLINFIDKCAYWQSVTHGLLWMFMKAFAKKENKLDQLNFTEKQEQEMTAYLKHVKSNIESTIQLINNELSNIISELSNQP